ncbi:MAG: polysaccharide biosynthesis protein [Flavobacteriales bacterium]|nr:polysaccharide biosynthesis protein [Flavobacteriales bacterium]
MIFRGRNTPRWIIFFIDLFIVAISITIAYLVRFNFSIPEIEIDSLPLIFPTIMGVRAISFLIAKIYAGIIRYTSNKDTERIFITLSLGSLGFVLVNAVTYFAMDGKFIIPFSIIIIEYLVTLFVMVFTRIFVKILYAEYVNQDKQKTNVLIFGAGEAGVISMNSLDRDQGVKYKIVAFIDDNRKIAGKKIEQIPIVHSEKLEEIIESNNVEHLIVSVQNLPVERLNEITETCLKHQVNVLTVPPVSQWINGELSFKQIKHVQIEDLLSRTEIKLDEKLISRQLSGKVVLITGAAGSIGSEIVRQVVKHNPKQVILVDQAESPLYDIEFEINQKRSGKSCEVVVGDVRSKERMYNVFRTFKPQIVYHAAAYKHVPLMENNPSEAILTNVLGTKIIADLAVEHDAERFVMVSTDKAVNPTNVMGASKRIAEIYTQSLNAKAKTDFITTRFGNVLGSNGSVIPLFKKQIEKGGPVTVTDPDINRYFMTIPEACQLVLEAGAMGNGGEIYVFDMGQSVKIVDLAKKMIKLSGLELGKDIQIVYTGLRPGEKLYEELLNNKENTLPTKNDQIMVAQVKEYDFDEVNRKIEHLIALFNTQDNMAIVKEMKDLVPEFKSKNSPYEKLDND